MVVNEDVQIKEIDDDKDEENNVDEFIIEGDRTWLLKDIKVDTIELKIRMRFSSKQVLLKTIKYYEIKHGRRLKKTKTSIKKVKMKSMDKGGDKSCT